MAHNFVSPWTPDQSDWTRLPELVKVKPNPCLAFLCSYGCGLSLIGGVKWWADFSAPLLITDTSRSNCPNAPSASAGATGAGASGPAAAVRHPRIDMAAVMTRLPRDPNGLGPQVEVLTLDERYMSHISESQRVNLSAAHTIDAPHLRMHERRLLRQLLTAVASTINGILAALLVEGEQAGAAAAATSKDFDVPHRAVILGEPASSKSKASSLLQGALIKILTARGLTERIDSLQTLQQQVFRITAKGDKPARNQTHQVQWLKAMHDCLRPDLAAIRDVLERKDRFFDPTQHLEQNCFTVLGAALTTGDAPAVRAFHRTELAREKAEAKKLGWKEPDPAHRGDEAASASGPAAAAPSPDRTGTADGDAGKDGKPSRKRPRKWDGKKGKKGTKPDAKKADG